MANQGGLPFAGEVTERRLSQSQQQQQENKAATIMAVTSTEVIVNLDEIRVDFTELPPEKLLCPDCGKVFRDPHLPNCCHGQTRCRHCLEKARGGEDGGKPCPSCGETSWAMEADGASQRSVNELYVRCLNVMDGCLWFGHLEQLPRHIDRENKSGCVFIKLACPHNCGEKHARKLLSEHVQNRCVKRPYTCEHCRGADGTFEEVESSHFPLCPQFPIPCPNKCPERNIPRSLFDNHVKNSCEYQENVPCPLAFAGCQAKLQRRHIPVHLEKGVANHLTLLSSAFLDDRKEVERKLEELPSQVQPPPAAVAPTVSFDSEKVDAHIKEALQSKDAEIRQMKLQLSQLVREKDEQNEELRSLVKKSRQALEAQERRLSLVEQLNHTLTRDLSALRQFVPSPLPITFTINKVETLRQSNKWWYSRPFYSDVQSYRFGMFVFCNGVLDGKGTHISVFLYLVKGDYDDDLDWPFRGNVTIQLLNQRADRQHYQKIIRFTDDTPPAVCNQVIGAEMAKEGNGPTQFISQSELTYNQEKDSEYIRDDCLKIRVASIHIKTGSIPPRTPGGNNTGTLSRGVPSGSSLIRAQTVSVDSSENQSNGYDTVGSPTHNKSPIAKSPSPDKSPVAKSPPPIAKSPPPGESPASKSPILSENGTSSSPEAN